MAMNKSDYIRDLLHFIGNAPTSFHAVQHISNMLREKGFTEILEQDRWNSHKQGSFFVRRNASSLIIFTLNNKESGSGFRMAGAHTDSPCLKVKPNPQQVNNTFMQLGVETYGGALLNPWFDRDLALAGRVAWRDKNNKIHSSLVDFKRPVGIIPSLAIHLDKEANEKKAINKQTDLVPIVMQVNGNNDADFRKIQQDQLILEHHDIKEPEIIDHELFFYDCQPPSFVGMNNEFITGARLDNLLSCYTLVRSLLDSKTTRNTLIVLNDHEETGSLSTSGAQGTFLQSVLERLLPDIEERQRCISRSVFISADNAHGVHPNFADRYDKDHLPQLNRGPVIKYNANQRYATNSHTSSFFKILCEKADIPVQEFVMRSDLACGSTIGPLTAGHIGVQTVDVGVSSLAMHSIRETAGSLDAEYLFTALKIFFSSPEQDEMWQCLVE